MLLFQMLLCGTIITMIIIVDPTTAVLLLQCCYAVLHSITVQVFV